jgi:hypothetical protein
LSLNFITLSRKSCGACRAGRAKNIVLGGGYFQNAGLIEKDAGQLKTARYLAIMYIVMKEYRQTTVSWFSVSKLPQI